MTTDPENVFVVTEGEYSAYEIVGLFSNQTDATACLAVIGARGGSSTGAR